MIRTAILEELSRRGWTRYRLAKEIGVHPQSVYRMLNSGKGMHIDNAERMMGVLGLGVRSRTAEQDTRTYSSSPSLEVEAGTIETA